MLIVSLLSTLISFSFAQLPADYMARSGVCNDKTIYDFETDIVCCDTLPGKSCKETVEATLTPQETEYLYSVVTKAMTEKKVQNCFKTALELTGGMPTSASLMLSPVDLHRTLEAQYVEITDGSMLPGDILFYEEQGMYRFWEEDGRRKKFFWRASEAAMHTAVYLGNDLLVQKENLMTGVVSIASLERTLASYRQFAKMTLDKAFYVEKRADLVVRVFRKN